MRLKIRPFEETCDGEIKAVKGEIIEERFIFSLDAASYEIPVQEIAEDNYGQYAIAEEFSIDLGFNYYLKLNPEYSPDETPDVTPGAELCFGIKVVNENINEVLLYHNIDLNRVNLLNNDCHDIMTIYFSHSGIKNGKGFPVRAKRAPKQITH